LLLDEVNKMMFWNPRCVASEGLFVEETCVWPSFSKANGATWRWLLWRILCFLIIRRKPPQSYHVISTRDWDEPVVTIPLASRCVPQNAKDPRPGVTEW
jgi:hypothetical protein